MDGAPVRLWHVRETSNCNMRGQRTQRLGCLLSSAGDGGDEHDLVTVLEGVGFAAEEADVFVVDVDVNEAAKLAVFAFDLRGERGEGLVDVGEKAGEILGSGVELFAAIGVAGVGGGGGGVVCECVVV